MHAARIVLANATIFIFLLFLFSSGIDLKLSSPFRTFRSTNIPDPSHFRARRVLSTDEFPTDDAHRRVIIVGDIHGMNRSMHALFSHIRYRPESDVLIHAGDMLSRGTHDGSMSVLSYMAVNNVTGVRGNHDQKVIEWWAWLDWMHSLDGGQRWLEDMCEQWLKAKDEGMDLKAWIKKMKKKETNWWRKVPKGWKLCGDHFQIARAMSRSEYEYLLSLPLVLHIPSAHTFIAHAGILSSDPHHKSSHERQPLAHLPSVPGPKRPADIPLLRRLQETAILSEVPQNKDPWVVLNMRGVLKDNTITRGSHGTPWSVRWNSDMARCKGFETDLKPKPRPLVCHPSTVIYGHAAARGLDVKRWSIGLDSGCIYKRRLTALVIGPAATDLDNLPDTEDDARSRLIIPYGDEGKGRIVSVACK
jgi:hypothetical protein